MNLCLSEIRKNWSKLTTTHTCTKNYHAFRKLIQMHNPIRSEDNFFININIWECSRTTSSSNNCIVGVSSNRSPIAFLNEDFIFRNKTGSSFLVIDQTSFCMDNS